MIMKEAGMDIPVSPKSHQDNLDQLSELKALRKKIGVPGLMVLRPVINEKTVDEWVMEELL